MAPAPPFPALVLGYFLNGLGLSFQVRILRYKSIEISSLIGSRMHKPMATLHPLSITPRPKWASFMRYMDWEHLPHR